MNNRGHPLIWDALSFLAIVFFGGLFPSPGLAQTIVWTDVNARKIQRKDVGGGEVATIVQFPSTQAASQIHYDPVSAKLYYLSGYFERVNLDGSDPEIIPTPSAGNFALNVELRRLYWIVGIDNVLNYSDLDGSGVASHTYPTCCLLALEAVGDDLFFGAGLTMRKGMWRADADGANEQFLHGSPQPLDLAYDPVETKLYVATEGIYRVNADGTDFQLVNQALANQVVVDSRGRKIYWSDFDAQGVQRIQRSNLDGSNVEDFVTGGDLGNPDLDIGGLTIVEPPSIPATSGWGGIAMSAILLASGLFVLRKHSIF